VPNAIPGRETTEIEIYGMEGIPEEDLAAHYAQLQDAEPKKQRSESYSVELSPADIQRQLLLHHAAKQGIDPSTIIQATPSIVSAPVSHVSGSFQTAQFGYGPPPINAYMLPPPPLARMPPMPPAQYVTAMPSSTAPVAPLVMATSIINGTVLVYDEQDDSMVPSLTMFSYVLGGETGTTAAVQVRGINTLNNRADLFVGRVW
jgi:hypothetical protein